MIRSIITLSIVCLLQACGGGGSESGTTGSTPGSVPAIDDEVTGSGNSNDGGPFEGGDVASGDGRVEGEGSTIGDSNTASDGTADGDEVADGGDTDQGEDAGQEDGARQGTSEAVVGMSAVYSVLL